MVVDDDYYRFVAPALDAGPILEEEGKSLGVEKEVVVESAHLLFGQRPLQQIR